MALHLSVEEKALIDELKWSGASDQEISDQVCETFNRPTLDRTTLYRWRRRRISSPKEKLPATPIQQEAFERCQVRSERYPEGNHSWMIGGRLADAFTVNQLDEDLTKGELVEESEGWSAFTSTCWFCSFTTEPKWEWGPIWVVSELDKV